MRSDTRGIKDGEVAQSLPGDGDVLASIATMHAIVYPDILGPLVCEAVEDIDERSQSRVAIPRRDPATARHGGLQTDDTGSSQLGNLCSWLLIFFIVCLLGRGGLTLHLLPYPTRLVRRMRKMLAPLTDGYTHDSGPR